MLKESPDPIPAEINDLTRRILACVFKVHTELGPGLLESVYQAALGYEMALAGIAFASQPGLPVRYKEIEIGIGLRPDFIVEGKVIIEIKSVAGLLPVHDAQVLTYLKVTGCRIGLLLNFNVVSMKEGIRRLIR